MQACAFKFSFNRTAFCASSALTQRGGALARRARNDNDGGGRAAMTGQLDCQGHPVRLRLPSLSRSLLQSAG